MTEDYRLLTVEQAAKELNVRWTAVRELIETGQLRAVKIGTRYRVPASALRELGVSSGVSSAWTIAAGPGRNGTDSRPLREINRRRSDGVR